MVYIPEQYQKSYYLLCLTPKHLGSLTPEQGLGTTQGSCFMLYKRYVLLVFSCPLIFLSVMLVFDINRQPCDRQRLLSSIPFRHHIWQKELGIPQRLRLWVIAESISLTFLLAQWFSISPTLRPFKTVSWLTPPIIELFSYHFIIIIFYCYK